MLSHGPPLYSNHGQWPANACLATGGSALIFPTSKLNSSHFQVSWASIFLLALQERTIPESCLLQECYAALRFSQPPANHSSFQGPRYAAFAFPPSCRTPVWYVHPGKSCLVKVKLGTLPI